MLAQAAINVKLESIRKNLDKLNVQENLDEETFSKDYHSCFGIKLDVPELNFYKGLF